MHCPACRFDNPPGMRFCGGCGAPLPSSCPACGADNPPHFRFCGGCGAPLAEAVPSIAVPPPPEPAAERRQLTVMFCDLVGSTALSERLDPEELRDVLRSYQAAAGEAVQRFGGQVAQYLGDGILVYFGYPIAHEDDARRAVLAGLAIVESVRAESGRFDLGTGFRLQVRIGIHTGPVVAGEIGTEGARERLALGQTPNIAARAQGLAEPDTVVATAATYRLVQGFFAAKSLGLQELKGISQPIELYHLLRESGVRNAFELAVARGLTPAVGRSQEMEILAERLEQVRQGHGQALLVMAEAGFGKSRLIKMFSDSAAAAGRWLICRCSPFLENSAFSPLIELLENAFRLRREDSATLRLHKLEEAVRRFGLPLAEVVPLLASLLSIPLAEGYASAGLSPQRQKERTLEILFGLLLRMSERQPVVFVMEDLHWIDPSTLEFLDLLVRRGPETRIFTLLTARPSWSSPWAPPLAPTRVDLDRLDDGEVAEMVSRVAGGKALPPELLRQVVEKTDGVPLFVEELTKMLLESGLLREEADRYELAGPLPSLAIPTTLQGSLTARLDHLTGARELAQVGATLGREFSYRLLAAVARLVEPILGAELGRLVDAGLLYQRGTPPHSIYVFKHALIQEAAYGSLLKSKRRQYHQRIAQVLTESFPEVAATRPELLAHHYTAADLKEPAIDHWILAGRHAIERFANLETIGHLRKGLELVDLLPASPERDERELSLQTALGPALIAIRGYAVPEVERIYARARELAERLGDRRRLFWVFWGLGSFNLVRADLKQPYGHLMLDIALEQEDRDLLLQAHFARGATACFRGEIRDARDHLEQCIAMEPPGRDQIYPSLTSDDAGVNAYCFAAFVLWIEGQPDTALARAHDAIDLARRIAHPYSLAFALTHLTYLRYFRRETAEVQASAQAAVAVAQEKGFVIFSVMSSVLLGWSLAREAPAGGEEAGLDLMLQSLGAWSAAGAGIWRPFYLSLLADLHARRGRIAEASRLIEEALATVDDTLERFWEAELHRLAGELALATAAVGEGDPAACRGRAEISFERALAVAASQGAKALELRATLSLARLWEDGGRRQEARDRLAGVVSGFAEGLDTPDLREASALLLTLSPELAGLHQETAT